MTISSSSIIISPSFFINTTESHISASHFRPKTTPRRQSLIASSSSNSGIELTSAEKKLLLESYGYDPDELLSSSSESPSSAAKIRRKKLKLKQRVNEVQEKKTEPKPHRTTHKLLQVLGGKAGRKKLLSPKGMDVRPMMEVVKGAAFAILQAAGGNPISLRPGRWLDLYSGTGSVGIEALSRGCAEVHFVEMDPWVVSDVLRPNLEWTGFLDASVIHTVCVENFLQQAEQFIGKEGRFDYISVTPPYVEVDYEVLMSQVRNSGLIGEDTFVVVEYPIKTDMMDTCGCLVKITERRFGRTNLVIYGPEWAQKQRMKE